MSSLLRKVNVKPAKTSLLSLLVTADSPLRLAKKEEGGDVSLLSLLVTADSPLAKTVMPGRSRAVSLLTVEMPGRILPVKEETPEEMPGRSWPAKEETPEEMPGRILPAKEEMPGRSWPAKEETPEEMPGRSWPAKEETPEEMPGRSWPAKETPVTKIARTKTKTSGRRKT